MKKEYIEVNSCIEELKRMAAYQEGDRQQGILGVISTLENWPRANVVEPSVSVTEECVEIRNFRCPNCYKEVTLRHSGEFYTDRPYCECGERMVEVSE